MGHFDFVKNAPCANPANKPLNIFERSGSSKDIGSSKRDPEHIKIFGSHQSIALLNFLNFSKGGGATPATAAFLKGIYFHFVDHEFIVVPMVAYIVKKSL